jgi:hypothetical protein
MSWNASEILAARRTILQVAQDMLAGRLSYIEGARKIVGAAETAGLDERNSDLLPFVGIVSETDALPFGEMRRHWQAAALDALQPEIDQKETWARQFGEPHCRKLVERFSKSTRSTNTDEPVEPDLKLGGFSLWVLGRQFPNAEDYWDGNWLNVRARAEAPGASAEAQGAIVHTAELARFVEQLESLHMKLVGEAALRCMEPNLQIVTRGDALGHVEVEITITPDHMTQSHLFKFDLDQTFLGPLLNECRNLLSRWPVRAATSA